VIDADRGGAQRGSAPGAGQRDQARAELPWPFLPAATWAARVTAMLFLRVEAAFFAAVARFAGVRLA
jgi:hypothetical protein